MGRERERRKERREEEKRGLTWNSAVSAYSCSSSFAFCPSVVRPSAVLSSARPSSSRPPSSHPSVRIAVPLPVSTPPVLGLKPETPSTDSDLHSARPVLHPLLLLHTCTASNLHSTRPPVEASACRSMPLTSATLLLPNRFVAASFLHDSQRQRYACMLHVAGCLAQWCL